MVLLHDGGGEVLDVGRRTRTVPSALRRALLSRDRFRVVPEEAEGQFRFLRPDGEPLPVEPPPVGWEGAPLAPTDARLAAAGISIGPHTATPDWYGETLDLQAALDVLWEPPNREQPAATAGVSPSGR